MLLLFSSGLCRTLVLSSFLYDPIVSTVFFGCAVPRHGIKIFGLSTYDFPRHYFIPYRNDVYPARFFTGKVLVKVPIGDMTDTLCLLGRLFSATARLKESPALNPTVNNHTLLGVVLSNRGVGMRKPPAKNK